MRHRVDRGGDDGALSGTSGEGEDSREAATDSFHEPVLAQEAVSLLDPSVEGLYLDGTVGGGGHAATILRRCGRCQVIAVDRDPEAVAEAAQALSPFGERVRVLNVGFDQALGDPEVQRRRLSGALLDLGVSSRQLDVSERGFTFGRGAPLDMRMGGPAAGGSTAADLLNHAPEPELSRLFREFGEEPRARRLARVVVRRRAARPFTTSDHLVAALASALGRAPTNREKARVFQALRIAVNDELETLARALPLIREVLLNSAVLVVIAYHSLEDRVVKRAFRTWSLDCVCPPELPICTCRGQPLGVTLTRRPVRPSPEEAARNPRARSALLRAWRRAA